jgi:hypothetical protein
LALLPILLLLVHQFIRLASRYLTISGQIIALLILFAQPTFLAHGSTVSVEIFLLAGTLTLVNGYLDKRKWVVMVSVAFLLLCSLRGMILVSGISLTAVLSQKPHTLRGIWKTSLPYIAGSIPFICWNVYHWSETGWVMSHAASPWIEHRGLANGVGLLRSASVFIFRCLEFGMLLCWIPLVLKWRNMHPETKNLLCLLLAMTGLLFIAMVPFNNPITNRYLLPVFVPAIILVTKSMMQFKRPAVWFLLIIIGMSSSHFYIYPEKWTKRIGYAHDATLVYLAYSSKMRPVVQTFLDESSGIEEGALIWAGFPAYHPISWSIPGRSQTLAIYQIDTQHVEVADYILLSNIMNEIPYLTQEKIRREWIPIYRKQGRLIYMELYQNPKLVKNG